MKHRFPRMLISFITENGPKLAKEIEKIYYKNC